MSSRDRGANRRSAAALFADLDGQPQQQQPQQPERPQQRPDDGFGVFSANTGGRGLRMLEKMGYKMGESLGRDGAGIVNPIQASSAGKNRSGLGASSAVPSLPQTQQPQASTSKSSTAIPSKPVKVSNVKNKQSTSANQRKQQRQSTDNSSSAKRRHVNQSAHDGYDNQRRNVTMIQMADVRVKLESAEYEYTELETAIKAMDNNNDGGQNVHARLVQLLDEYGRLGEMNFSDDMEISYLNTVIDHLLNLHDACQKYTGDQDIDIGDAVVGLIVKPFQQFIQSWNPTDDTQTTRTDLWINQLERIQPIIAVSASDDTIDAYIRNALNSGYNDDDDEGDVSHYLHLKRQKMSSYESMFASVWLSRVQSLFANASSATFICNETALQKSLLAWFGVVPQVVVMMMDDTVLIPHLERRLQQMSATSMSLTDACNQSLIVVRWLPMISYREVDRQISQMLASHAQCDFTEWLTLVEVWIPLPFHTVSSTAISSRELTRFRRNVIMPQFQKYCHEISSGPCPSEETLDPIVAKLDNIIGTARCEAWLFGELGGRVVEVIRERHLSNLVSKLGLDPAAPATASPLDTNQGWLEWFKRKSERYPALQRIVALINICQ